MIFAVLLCYLSRSEIEAWTGSRKYFGCVKNTFSARHSLLTVFSLHKLQRMSYFQGRLHSVVAFLELWFPRDEWAFFHDILQWGNQEVRILHMVMSVSYQAWATKLPFYVNASHGPMRSFRQRQLIKLYKLIQDMQVKKCPMLFCHFISFTC